MPGESLRDQLQSTYDTLSAAEPEAPVVAAAPEPVAAAEGAAPVEAVAATPDTTPEGEKPAGAQDRDEHGRFKPKGERAEGAQAAAPAAPPEPKIETAKPADEGAQGEPTRIPPSLSAAVKAQWADLPPAVQKDIARLEDTVQTAKAEWGRKGERLNRYDEILGPHVDRWRASGLDEYSGLQTLIAAQSLLDRNPLDGILHIARSYGMTPAHLAQAFGLSQASGQHPGQEGQRAPTGAPDMSAALQQHLAPLVTQVQTLQQQLQTSQQASEAAKLAEAQGEVQTFAADPAHRYFENVRAEVVAILQSGRAQTLKDAYEKAVWADPEIRPLLLAEQAKTASAEAAKKAGEDAARAKSSSARQAAGSVTGAPTPGATSLQQGPRPSLRDELRQTYQTVNGQL